MTSGQGNKGQEVKEKSWLEDKKIRAQGEKRKNRQECQSTKRKEDLLASIKETKREKMTSRQGNKGQEEKKKKNIGKNTRAQREKRTDRQGYKVQREKRTIQGTKRKDDL